MPTPLPDAALCPGRRLHEREFHLVDRRRRGPGPGWTTLCGTTHAILSGHLRPDDIESIEHCPSCWAIAAGKEPVAPPKKTVVRDVRSLHQRLVEEGLAATLEDAQRIEINHGLRMLTVHAIRNAGFGIGLEVNASDEYRERVRPWLDRIEEVASMLHGWER